MATISSLFGGHAPFKQLQAHMRVVVACARKLPDAVEAVIAEDRETLKVHAKEIFRLEAEADALKNELRVRLPRSLFMPVDRRDLLEILHRQDSIADTAEDIVGAFLAREMTIPEPMQEGYRELVTGCVEVVERTGEIIGLLDELIEVGFGGKTAQEVERLAEVVNQTEDHTDGIERALGKTLFSLEGEMDPVTVMFWYRLLEWTGDLADHAEKVGNSIRLIIAR